MKHALSASDRTSFTEPTYLRYKVLSKKIRKVSLTRALQYEILESCSLKGKVLDFGGGEKVAYRDLINCSSYDSLNIDPDVNPTWVVNVGDKLPCDTGTYDTVISLNTLEHIFDAQFVINELGRVLKPGGDLFLSVPFLYPIHGHPDDFFRPTPSWFRHACENAGFTNIEVTPLTWGPFTASMICSGLPGPIKGIRKNIALLNDLLYFRLSRKRHSSSVLEKQMTTYATAFFVRATKGVRSSFA